jgi:hypothetical protein
LGCSLKVAMPDRRHGRLARPVSGGGLPTARAAGILQCFLKAWAL